MLKQFYETERLVLKTIDETKAQQVLDYYARNKEFLRKWEPSRDETFFTLDCHRESLLRDMDSITRGDTFRLWIYKKEDTSFEKIIGTIGLSNIVRGAFLSCFLGYKLDKDEVNKGYMKEALGKTIEIAFGELKLHRIEANIIPENIASRKVIEALGFYHEGVAKKYLRINGAWEDHIHMVLRNGEME
ncbi:MAG: GNAT family N-acetyltransferase [Bacillota bacterium]